MADQSIHHKARHTTDRNLMVCRLHTATIQRKGASFLGGPPPPKDLFTYAHAWQIALLIKFTSNFRVVLLLCGGNIDTTILGRCLERGLAVDGRLMKFSVNISDRPGGIAELTRLLAQLEVSIKDIIHERAWVTSNVFGVKVRSHCILLPEFLLLR